MQRSDVTVASEPGKGSVFTTPSMMPHGLAQLPEKLGRSAVAASTHPIGTTQGRPRHDLWTKLR
jgi:hypothetical protein